MMTPQEREAHIRRMLEHGKKVQDQFRQDKAEFEAGCRAFWDFMRRYQVERDKRLK